MQALNLFISTTDLIDWLIDFFTSLQSLAVDLWPIVKEIVITLQATRLLIARAVLTLIYQKLKKKKTVAWNTQKLSFLEIEIDPNRLIP